jgi:hypothetical protein
MPTAPAWCCARGTSGTIDFRSATKERRISDIVKENITWRAGREREAFLWRFVTPLFMSSTLNPINSSLIATA